MNSVTIFPINGKPLHFDCVEAILLEHETDMLRFVYHDNKSAEIRQANFSLSQIAGWSANKELMERILHNE